MPRTARIVAPGVAHHITQRGNNRQDVFFADDDRRLYLQFLRDCAETHGLEVHAYCLMSNHVHLVATPQGRAPRPIAVRHEMTLACSTRAPFARRYPSEQWKRILSNALGEQEVEQLQRALHTGRPLASDHWLAKLEAKIGRRVRALPHGRPRSS